MRLPVPENWVQHPVINTEEGSNPGAPLAGGSPENPDDAVAGYGYVPCDTSEVEETFYYHSDHLGSTSYITDQQANVTQYDAYLPYGELLVDEHSSSADLPYKFNGKELDEETGLYYYGARYMNPIASIWYGVDPLTEKNVSSSSYFICNGNPVTYIDPNGLDTLNIIYNQKTDHWDIQNVKLAAGHDVFNLTYNGKTRSEYFTPEKKGDVEFLYLEISPKKSGDSFGVYHIHGSNAEGSTGYFVAPGGKASIKKETHARVPDGTYPMTTPKYNEGRWRLPGLGGLVKNRGIRIHFGSDIARKWSLGCFIISSDYKKENGRIVFDGNESRRQVIAFNKILGASKIDYYYDPDRKYKPLRALYNKTLKQNVIVGSLYDE